MGGLKFALVEILVVLAGPIDRLVEDFDISQKLLEARVLRLSLRGGVNGRSQFGELLGQRHLVGLR